MLFKKCDRELIQQISKQIITNYWSITSSIKTIEKIEEVHQDSKKEIDKMAEDMSNIKLDFHEFFEEIESIHEIAEATEIKLMQLEQSFEVKWQKIMNQLDILTQYLNPQEKNTSAMPSPTYKTKKAKNL